MKIGYFSKELAGPYKNGGIGTANANLAILLAKKHNVDFIYCNTNKDGPQVAEGSFEDWVNFYGNKGINLDYLEFNDFGPRSRSYDAWMRIRDAKFDAVIFDDYGGLGFYTVCAKVAGLTNVSVVTVLHSPNHWLQVANKMPPRGEDEIVEGSMEQYAVENSDYVIHPSRFLKQWLEDYGWTFPPKTKHINLHIDIGGLKKNSPYPTGQKIQPSAIVFFGRLEERKGVDIFLRAISQLEDQLKGRKVIFCGKPGHIEGKNAIFEILMRLKDTSIDFSFMLDLDSQRSMAMMREENAIAVMPSPEDNSPCVVYECIQAQIPFLASNNSGAVELVDPETPGDAFIYPNAIELRNRLSRILTTGYTFPKPIYDLACTGQAYFDLFAEIAVNKGALQKVSGNPLVSICVTHFNQSALLRQELESLANQSYRNIEVIVVDDGSTKLDHQTGFAAIAECYKDDYRFTFLNCENRYLGAARNTAIQKAKGDFIVFCDDDNVQFPNMVETLVAAALASDADIVIPMASPYFSAIKPEASDVIRPDWLPLGPAGTDASLTNNVYGDANALFRRRLFDEIGLLDEEYGFTAQDWQIFTRASLAKKKIVLLPQQLSFYRVRPDSMFRTSSSVRNYMPVLREYWKAGSNSIKQSLFMFVEKTHLAEAAKANFEIDKVFGIDGLRDAIFDLESTTPHVLDKLRQLSEVLGLGHVFYTAIADGPQRSMKQAKAIKTAKVIGPANVQSLVVNSVRESIGAHASVGLLSDNSVLFHANTYLQSFEINKARFAHAGDVSVIIYPDGNAKSELNYSFSNLGNNGPFVKGKTKGFLRFDRNGVTQLHLDKVSNIDHAKLYAMFIEVVSEIELNKALNGLPLEPMYNLDGRRAYATEKVEEQYWKAEGHWGQIYLHPVVGRPAEILLCALPKNADRVRFQFNCEPVMPNIAFIVRSEDNNIIFAWELDASDNGTYIELDTSKVDASKLRFTVDANAGSHAYCGVTLKNFLVG